MKKQPQTATTEKPITENVEIYPAGRGKVLLLIKKSIPPKTKQHKHPQPHKTHVRIKCNPDDMTITEYLDTTPEPPHRHIYLFPEKRELTIKEVKNIALSLLAILPRLTVKRLLEKTSSKFPVFLNQEDRATVKQKYKRYKRWRKRHQS